MNNMKTVVLLAGLTALLIFIGGLIGGKAGVIIALIFAAVMNLGSYWFSDKIVLKMFDAREVGEGEASGLYDIVRTLAQRANTPMPKVYIIDNETPNAFATGRNPENAAVAATTGLLRTLNRNEVMGVMAHELGHVIHRDTLISAVSATIAGAISGIANMFMFLSIFGGNDREGGVNPVVGILLMILAPIAAMLIQMAISRSREYEADKAGAELCGNPHYLADALEKLERCNRIHVYQEAEQHPAAAHLFIINPLNGQQVANLFSTHPVTAERIRRLRAMR